MLCLSLWHVVVPAAAQSWPARPIRIVVTFPPGGSSDIVARVLAEAMSPKFGQRVVVDYRPGAGGTLAIAHVSQQPADGYTLMLSNTAPIVNSPPLCTNPGNDPVKSFTHIAYLDATTAVVVTNLSVPATDMKGLMAWMRAQPQPVTYGTSGAGSVGHVVGSIFTAQTGIALNHAPYRGSIAMQADLLGRSTLLSFDTLPENVEKLRRAAARLFRHGPNPRAPRPRGADHSGSRAAAVAGSKLAGPVGTGGTAAGGGGAAACRSRGSAEATTFQERLATVGSVSGAMTQPEFAGFVAEQVGTMGAAVHAMGIKND